jgi:hypothetical protein
MIRASGSFAFTAITISAVGCTHQRSKSSPASTPAHESKIWTTFAPALIWATR